MFARYRVDTLPRHLSPFVQAFGVLGAAALAAGTSLAGYTCDWKMETPDGTSIPYTGPCIHCTWHENIPTYLSYYFARKPKGQKHLWLQHPAAYMLPVHKFLEWNNVDYVLGSSGHGGQEAMEILISRIQDSSYSSAFFPDGPSGPVHQVKPGVVQVAQATGLPIIPIQFQFESSLRAGWDQKHFPIPYSTVHIKELEPILAGKEDDPHATAKMLEGALNS